MEDLSFQHKVRERAGGTRRTAIIGVVASGNLEVLVERVLPDAECLLEIKTAAVGFGEVWKAVIADFVERYSPGGLEILHQRRRRASGHRVASPGAGGPIDRGGRAMTAPIKHTVNSRQSEPARPASMRHRRERGSSCCSTPAALSSSSGRRSARSVRI